MNCDRIVWQTVIVFVLVLAVVVETRDFYIGMFKNQDYLVAQDRLFKERVPFNVVMSKYGRVFMCKITYLRVSDRLGYGPGPRVEVIRGGLNSYYIVIRITSVYNRPLAVNIYVGCGNYDATKPVFIRATPSSGTISGQEGSISGAGGNSEGDGGPGTAASDGAPSGNSTEGSAVSNATEATPAPE